MTSNDRPPEALERYFHHLANDEFTQAAQQYTEDAVYYHPPNFRSEARIEGRDAIESYFKDSRGSKAIEHEIEKVVRSDAKCGIVGYLTGEDVDGEDYFVSYAKLEDGKIAYYMAGLLKGRV